LAADAADAAEAANAAAADAVEERERRIIVIQNIYYRKFICDYPLINFSCRSMIR
jgi:hypothetical protein